LEACAPHGAECADARCADRTVRLTRRTFDDAECACALRHEH
jgi:hypothetical protein